MYRKSVAISLIICLCLCARAHAEPSDMAARAQAYLEYICQNFANRDCVPDDAPADDANRHHAARDWIILTLKALGYAEEQIAYAPEAAFDGRGAAHTVHNIELSVSGQNADKQIIIGAHYDGKGAGDNASGVALMLAVIGELRGETPPYALKFVFFDGEELGLLGSNIYANKLSDADVSNTAFMVNIDGIAFGDYMNLYGGAQDLDTGAVTQTSAYELAVARARELGFAVFASEDLDGYFAEHGKGPEVVADALYTNPWTLNNPAPMNAHNISPSTGDWSDHTGFKYRGIPYVYFEAANWFAEGDGGPDAYTGYFETYNTALGYCGMFMNTEYDTLKNLNNYFPGRALEHFGVYAELLCAILRAPEM